MEEQEFKRVLALFPVVDPATSAPVLSFIPFSLDSIFLASSASDRLIKILLGSPPRILCMTMWYRSGMTIGTMETKMNRTMRAKTNTVNEVLSVDAAKKFITSSSDAQE